MNPNRRRIILSLVAILLGAGYLLKVIPPETDVGVDENLSVSIDGSLVSNPLDINESILGSPLANSVTGINTRRGTELIDRLDSNDSKLGSAPLTLVPQSAALGTLANGPQQEGESLPGANGTPVYIKSASQSGGFVGAPQLPNAEGRNAAGGSANFGNSTGHSGSGSHPNSDAPVSPNMEAPPWAPEAEDALAPPSSPNLTLPPDLGIQDPQIVPPTSSLPPEWLKDGNDTAQPGNAEAPIENVEGRQTHHVAESGRTVAFLGLALSIMAFATRKRARDWILSPPAGA